MQEAISLPVMLLIAALMVAVGGLVVWHFQDAQRVTDWAAAAVYPLAKPYNSTHFWLGAQAAFADVEISRVAVDNTTYVQGVRAPQGRQVWLNYSGGPLLVKCNSTVAYEVERGSASRVLQFKTICPQGVVKSVYVEDVSQILREMNAYASFVFNYLEFLNSSVLAVDVIDNGKTVFIALYNTWKWPLFVYAARLNWQDLPWYGSWIASPTPPGPWGLLFDLTTPLHSPNDYIFHFAGTLMPGDYLKVWLVGEVWYRPHWASGYEDSVELVVAYTAFITDNFGYVNGKIIPKNGSVAAVKNPQFIGDTRIGTESPTVIFRFSHGDVLTYDAQATCQWGRDGCTLLWLYNYNNLGKAGAAAVRVSHPKATYYKVYQAWPNYGTGFYPIIIYAFPAMPVAANASSTGSPYLEIGGKTVYGEQVIKGVAGLSPVRVYAVEARNNRTHWLISAGVPGYGIALNESALTALSKPGGYVAVEASTGYVRIRTPDGGVYERKTPYWTDPVPGFVTYKSPIVAYLTPDAQYWVAIAGYRPGDGALLLKSNAPLTCQSIGPGLYVLPRGSCTGAGAIVEYYLKQVGEINTTVFQVRYPLFPSLRKLFVTSKVFVTGSVVVYKIQPLTTDPKAFFDKFSKIRAVWVEMVNGTFAKAYVKDYPGDASAIPAKPPSDAALAKNGTQFSVPVLYDISPRGIEPYVLYISTDAYDKCLGYPYRGRRQYVSQFEADLYHKGVLVSYYKQALSVMKIEGCEGTEQPAQLSAPPTCVPTRQERFTGNQTQKKTRINPDGTYYTEVWGKYEITETDCQGNVKTYYEQRRMYVVRRGHGTYSNADPGKGYICGISNVKLEGDTVGCQQPG